MTAVYSAFDVCTYNIGGNFADWVSSSKSTDQAAYVELQERTAESLIAEDGTFIKPDVFCLQEVYEVNVMHPRPIINTLRDQGFAIFHASGRSNDCVVALKEREFTNFHNLSEKFKGYDAAIVAATHIDSGERYVFVSAHAPGCDIEGTVNPQDAKDGDEYCRLIAERLSEIANLVIVGVDMNVSPEKWKKRFDEFGPSFETLRTNSPTNIKPNSPSFKNRELDYFLTRIASVSSRWFGFFQTKCSIYIDLTRKNPVRWDNNPSDHLPVIAAVTRIVTPSMFSKIVKCLSSTFIGQSIVTIGFFGLWYVYDGYQRGA